MNDRLGSMDTDINGGNIRYYGADPNNYVWLGDTYTSDYTFNYNGEEITRHANNANENKKLWRIIGVFDGRLKLIQADPIYPSGLSWDSSANEAGGNSGYGINQWGPSGTYEGADLMRLLNDEVGPYWMKSSGAVYTRYNNATIPNVSFANTGLSTTEKRLISSAIWYLGAYEPGEDTDYDGASYTDIQYAAERQNVKLGKICTQGESGCDDTVTRTSSWSGKVGLMYPSDYGYAVDFNDCTNDLYNYDAEECYPNDWLSDTSNWQWTISPRAASDNAHHAFGVDVDGYVGNDNVGSAGSVRPVVYLKSGVTISGGNGSQSTPYQILG